jgi:sugar phosphate isomerase/epimerase
MKLSCLPVSFFREIIGGAMGIGQWAALGKSLGLDGIDLSVLFLHSLDKTYLHNLRRGIDEEGIRVAVLNTYPDLTHPEGSERSRELAQLEVHIEAAKLLGAEMVRVTAGQGHPETSRSEGIEWAAEGLRRAAGKAEDAGVTPVYENHSKPGVWDYPDFSYASDIFLEIADRLQETCVKILFDTANPVSRGEKPLPILENVIGRLSCVHAADTSSDKGLQPVLLGTGLVPFDDIFSFLKQSGYTDWISIEEASGLGERGIEKAIKFVRNRWEAS